MEQLADEMVDYILEDHTLEETMDKFNRPVLITKAKQVANELEQLTVGGLR